MKLFGSWWLPPGDGHFEEYLAAQAGEYQKQHRSISIASCPNRRIALDVGAHVGFWSRDLAREFDEVIAFEPVAELRQCFVRNVTADNVSLYPYALGNADGHAEMDFSPGNSGATHIRALGTTGVEVRTLDSFELDLVDFIKIDVEGFELYVLEGARETLLRCRPVVTIEQKAHSGTHYGVPQYAAREYLESLGAKVQTRVVDDWVLAWPF